MVSNVFLEGFAGFFESFFFFLNVFSRYFERDFCEKVYQGFFFFIFSSNFLLLIRFFFFFQIGLFVCFFKKQIYKGFFKRFFDEGF